MEFLLLLVIPIIIVVLYYNNLVRRRNQVDNAFSAIDVMLKKRFDLIPNLIEVVKQYASHEQTTLTQIAALRTQGMNADTTESKANIDRQLAQSVGQLMVQVENYPDLKANQNFIHLQRTWTESEEQIAAARRTFNSNVTSYNNAIMTFPGNLFAGMFSFERKNLLETPYEERQNISARDLFNS